MKRRIEKVVAKIEIVTNSIPISSLQDHREALQSDYTKHFIANAIKDAIPSKVYVEIEYADCWDVEGDAQ